MCPKFCRHLTEDTEARNSKIFTWMDTILFDEGPCTISTTFIGFWWYIEKKKTTVVWRKKRICSWHIGSSALMG